MAGDPTATGRVDRAGGNARSVARDLKETVKQAAARAGLVGTTSRQAHEIIKRARRAPPPDDDATALARQARKWHMDQRDRLPFAQCKRIVAALQDCPGWTALAQRSSGSLSLDDETLLPAIARLKQFGYTAEAATALISFLVERGDADGSKTKGATR